MLNVMWASKYLLLHTLLGQVLSKLGSYWRRPAMEFPILCLFFQVMLQKGKEI